MRNTQHWLTPEALRSGAREQYARERQGVRLTVELVSNPIDDVVQWTVRTRIIARGGTLVELHEWHVLMLNDARKRWASEMRKARSS